MDLLEFLRERGGVRQQAEIEALLAPPPQSSTSMLADRLLMLFGWGLLSAGTIQWLASGAVDDGLSQGDIVAIARIGSGGRFSGNSRRDLLRRFCPKMHLAKPCPIPVRIKLKDEQVVDRALDILPPTTFVESVYREFPSVFKRMYGESPREFWDAISPRDPKLLAVEQHLVGIPDWRSRAIPYMLHGDGARFTERGSNSLLTISMKSLLAKGFDGAIVPLFTLPKRIRAPTSAGNLETMDELWKWTIHLLNGMFDGVHPPLDPYGRPWPSSELRDVAGKPFCGKNYIFICWALVGDMEFLSNEMRFPHFNGSHPCHLCRANRLDDDCMTISDLSSTAAWKCTIISPAEGMFVNINDHVLWGLRGLSRFHCIYDLMHTSDFGFSATFSEVS